MSDLTLRKTSPTGNDMKSTAQGTTLKQQGFHEVNKRRTFLQDNSWIKERPEEEKDENYARVVLHRRNSHDASDRKTNERDEPKATISWYRSDGTLDRNTSTFRSPEETKMQPGGLFSANATNTPASNSATTPVKKKRQSWFPPPPPGYKAAPSTGASGREPTVHPPIPPKPSSSVSSPNQLRQDNRQICPPKPSAYTETNRSAERNIRSQDLENVVKVDTSFQKADKGPKSLENLLVVNTRTDKDGKGGEDLDNVIKVNPKESENTTGKQDLDGLIKVNPETNKNIKSSEQDLDELINVSPKAVKNTAGNQDLDKLIKVNPETLSNNQRNRDLNNLIKVNPEVIRSNQRDQDLENLIEVNSNMSKSKNESSNAETRHAGPKGTLVYTRTYVENSKSPKDRYQEGISGKYIQTIYSTSDRSVIEMDMCTYCRKPLGTEAKMILNELQICCHSTCFKCEICKQPLENLQAGDSIWIYRQTIHCEHCYSQVVAKWIQ